MSLAAFRRLSTRAIVARSMVPTSSLALRAATCAVAATPARALSSSFARAAAMRGAAMSRVSAAASSSAAARVSAPRRYLNLHEYQSKDLMAQYKVRVQRGEMATTPAAARAAAERLLATGAKELVIKAQIHAGGRGKGHFNTGFKGGVKVCSTAAEIEAYAKEMLGNVLFTKQTGPEGQPVHKVLVHEGINFSRELYFAIVMDRTNQGPVIIASQRGGMDIEEVAETEPNAIFTERIDIVKGLQPEQTARLAKLLGFDAAHVADAQQQMANLYKLFLGSDATQVEINPLVVATDGLVYCVDAKINFDESAAYRQEAIFAQRDASMEDPREVAASKFGLNYIGLDGNIGCLVNGAGLAMATMDIISIHGGSPANFLDVGGNASEKQVEEAFRILTSDKHVKALLVNIFGGIMRCDVIANGIVNAAKNIDLRIPLVVRLAGTNVELGNEILTKSGIKVITATDLDDAAKKAVASMK